jgi:hypothetical protein
MGNSVSKSELLSHSISQGTCSELIEMLVVPSLWLTSFKSEFFFALNYIVESGAMLARVWEGIVTTKQQQQQHIERWKDVLEYW